MDFSKTIDDEENIFEDEKYKEEINIKTELNYHDKEYFEINKKFLEFKGTFQDLNIVVFDDQNFQLFEMIVDDYTNFCEEIKNKSNIFEIAHIKMTIESIDNMVSNLRKTFEDNFMSQLNEKDNKSDKSIVSSNIKKVPNKSPIILKHHGGRITVYNNMSNENSNIKNHQYY